MPSETKIQFPPRPFQGKNTNEFSSVLQKLSLPRKAIAIDLGIPYSTYDNYYHGVHPFPPDLIPKLYEITRDIEIITFFLEPLGLVPVDVPHTVHPSPKNIRKQEVLLSIGTGQINKFIEKAIEDGKIDNKEYLTIHRSIRKNIINESKLDYQLRCLAEEG